MNPKANDTPRFLLLNQDGPIGPDIKASSKNERVQALYTFSSKAKFDLFTASQERNLKPYPLVAQRLKTSRDKLETELLLLVIDAPDERQVSLHAVSSDVVLEAIRLGLKDVRANYQLEVAGNLNQYEISILGNATLMETATFKD